MAVDLLRNMRDRLENDARYSRPSNIGVQSSQETAAPAEPRTIPDDLWVRCPGCGSAMFRDDFVRMHSICSHCGFHDRLTAWQRIGLVADQGSVLELDAGLAGGNPIEFPGYLEKIAALQKKTGLTEAVVCARAAIHGLPCLIGAMDSRFMMASMGAAVGEKITRLFERATAERLPVILFTASGGARMQEGIVSLMQMAKTAAAVGRHQEAGLLYISVLTDPTTGGVTASFASLGDFLISEPGTLIGFAGRRVIEGTIAQELPDSFQRAEFLLEHGFLDLIIPRSRMRDTLHQLLDLHALPATETETGMTAAIAGGGEAPGGGGGAIGSGGKGSRATGSEDEPVVQDDSKSVPEDDSKSVSELSAEACLDMIRQKGRPVIGDYLPLVFDEAIELHGDRLFREDSAIYGGIGRIGGQPVTIIAHRKGRTLDENTRANFGMPHPEGYRKAMRLMRAAEKFGRPIVCMIDTSGAHCGVGAEERGQGEAIARNLMDMMALKVPVIALVMGEGGSGGALAIGVADRMAMLGNALYSVISPRGFASILWKDPSREREAANLLKITARDLKRLGICDVILPEPEGGAHLGLTRMAATIRAYLLESLADLRSLDADALRQRRYERFRKIGEFRET